MSRSLGSLTVDLLMRTGQFETDAGRAARTAEQRAKEIDAAFAKAGAAIGASIAAGVGVATAAISHAIDHMDEMSKAAQRAQMPTEDFSRLAFAAKLADVSMQDLQGSVGKLAKAQGSALDATSKQARIFDALGISVKNADGTLRSTKDVMLDFADVFARNQDKPELMAAGMALFGKSFQNIIPLIKDGSAGLRELGDESDRLGQTISTEAGKAAEEFNDNMTRMKSLVSGAAMEIASGMLPKLSEMSTEMVAAAEKTDSLREFGEGLITVLGGVGKAIGFVSGMARQLGIDLGTVLQAREGLADMALSFNPWSDSTMKGGYQKITGAFDTRHQMMVEQATKEAEAKQEAVNAAAEAAYRRNKKNLKYAQYDGPLLTGLKNEDLNKLDKALGPKPAKPKKPKKPKGDGEAKRLAEEQRKWREQLQLTQAQLDGPTAEANAKYHKALSDLEAEAKKLHLTEDEIAQKRKTIDAEHVKWLDEAAEKERRLKEARGAPEKMLADMDREQQLIGVIGDQREVLAERIRAQEEMERALNEARKAGKVISADQEAHLKAEAEMRADAIVVARQQASEVQHFFSIWEDALTSVGDALDQFVLSGFKSWKSFGQSLADTAKKAIADVLAQFMRLKLIKPIMDGLQGSGSVWSNLLSAWHGSGGNSGSGFWGSLASMASQYFGGGNKSGYSNAGQSGNNALGNAMQVASYAKELYGVFAGGGGAAAGAGSAGGAGASGGASSGLAAAGWVAAIIYGMYQGSEWYRQGWQANNNKTSDIMLGSVGSVAVDKILQGLGVSPYVAGWMSGSAGAARMWGYKNPELRGSGIQGSVGFSGFDGQSYSDYVRKAGMMRKLFGGKDKWTTVTGGIDPGIDNAFDSAAMHINLGVRDLAGDLGKDISAALSSVRIDIGKMQLDSDPEKAREQIQKKLQDVADQLSAEGVKALGFGELLGNGFAPSDVMSGLAASIKLVTKSATELGRALNAQELTDVADATRYFESEAMRLGGTIADQVQRVMGVLANYSGIVASADKSIKTNGLSAYQKQQLEVELTYRDQVKQLNTLAKSLGLVGARSEDLAKLEQLRAINMANLQQQMEAQKDSWLADLSLSDQSPLLDSEKLAQAMQLLDQSAKGGDVQNAQKYAQQALGFGKNLYASGADYNALYGQVTSIIESISTQAGASFSDQQLKTIADGISTLPEDIARALFREAAGLTPATTTTSATPPAPVTPPSVDVPRGGMPANPNDPNTPLLISINDRLGRLIQQQESAALRSGIAM